MSRLDRYGPVRATACCHRSMKDRSLSDLVAAVRSRPPLRRSTLYRWLHSHRRVIAKMLARENPSWIVVAESVAAADVVNTRGQPASPASVRRVWACVLKDTAAAETARARKTVQPSRLPATWKPIPVPSPRAADPARYAPPLPTPAMPAPTEMSEKVRAKLAALDRQLDHRDRFVNPPKRKD